MISPDTSDFPALLARYERPLVRYAQSIVGDVNSARDVVQDVFIKLARGGVPSAEGHAASDGDGASAGGGNGAEPTRHSAPGTRHLEAWLFTVTRNRALDHHRKHRRIIP